jgi:hypothetical protein
VKVTAGRRGKGGSLGEAVGLISGRLPGPAAGPKPLMRTRSFAGVVSSTKVHPFAVAFGKGPATPGQAMTMLPTK